jgi:hypothetical protein
MKNVTITLDDELMSWARVEAARQGKSLSRFIGEAVAQKRAPDLAEQVSVLDGFLSGPGWAGVSKELPTREELYDRPALRRHESPDLRDGPGGAREAAEDR